LAAGKQTAAIKDQRLKGCDPAHFCFRCFHFRVFPSSLFDPIIDILEKFVLKGDQALGGKAEIAKAESRKPEISGQRSAVGDQRSEGKSGNWESRNGTADHGTTDKTTGRRDNAKAKAEIANPNLRIEV
jgi:hypothetical protein